MINNTNPEIDSNRLDDIFSKHSKVILYFIIIYIELKLKKLKNSKRIEISYSEKQYRFGL